MPPKPLQDPRRRRLLIYGGMAAAMLLVLLLARRQSQNAAAAQAQPTAQPVSNPAVDPASYYSGGSGAGGVDYGPQLATLDTDVQTLAQAVAAGQSSAQTPGPSTPGVSGTDPSGLITAVVGAVAAGASIANGNRQPGPGNTPPAKPSTRPKRPAGAPAGAVWSGPRRPGSNWTGIGGGWWAPPRPKGPGNRKR